MKLIVWFATAVSLYAASLTDYEHSIADWRAQREAQLKADDGWLTVVGLHWLKEGANRVGSHSDFEVPLPKSAPERVGVITLKNGVAHFVPEKGRGVAVNGAPAKEVDLKPDIDERYDRLSVGRVKFFVIKRENRYGVRVKDNDSAARKQFTGLKWYPVDANWKVKANYIPWDKPHTITFETAVGVKEKDESPGYVTFQKDGREYRMEPVLEDHVLWFVMRDQTSGKTTYAASRFLYTPPPSNGVKKAGTVEIDFNRAENPPCVFTDFATCPLPPPQNRLQLAVTAGELMYGHAH